MRSPLAKVVRQRFSERLRAELPQFAEVTERAIPPGAKLFRWDVADDLTFFVLLQFHHHTSDDSFTVELAWARHGGWPAFAAPTREPIDTRADTMELRIRLGRLLDAPNGDYWWSLVSRPSLATAIVEYLNPPSVEELLPRVGHLVDDAVHLIEEAGMPYFGKVAAAYGHDL